MWVEKNVANNELHDNLFGENKGTAWIICTEETVSEEPIKGRLIGGPGKVKPIQGKNVITCKHARLWSWGCLSLAVISIWTYQLLKNRSS